MGGERTVFLAQERLAGGLMAVAVEGEVLGMWEKRVALWQQAERERWVVAGGVQ